MSRLFALSLILLVCLLASNSWAAPNLVIEQPTYDFGEVSQGQMVRHSFSFSNDGDDPLLIEKVGCWFILCDLGIPVPLLPD